MKTLISTITNTYKAVRLLSNPHVGAYLQSQLETPKTARLAPIQEGSESEAFGTHNAFYHKHYIVQVLN